MRRASARPLAASTAVLAVALTGCHVCPNEKDCDRWFKFDHEQPLRAAEFAVAVGLDGALAIAEDDAEFPYFHYEPRDAGTVADLHGVSAHASSHASCPYIVVGDHGTIRISDDGGDTWRTPKGPAIAAALRAVEANCPFKTGIAVGDAGTVMVASGAPETWQARDGGTDRPLRSVALAAKTAVAVGDGGTVVRSGDSGDTWAPVAVETTADLLSVALSSSLDGGPAVGMIGAADGTLLASRDGGESWSWIGIEFDAPIRQVEVGEYVGEGEPASLTAFFLAEGGLWTWSEAESRLQRMYWLDLPVYSFAYAPELTLLVDGGALAYKWCMGCD